MKNEYQPLSPRNRLLIFILGVSTALLVAWLLLERPGGVHGPKYVAPVPICATPQDSRCIGGKAEVIMLPATPAMSTAPAASGAAR